MLALQELTLSWLNMPQEIACIDIEDCMLCWVSIEAYRSYWLPRNARCGFFTLGTPSYMDARDSLKYYCYRAREYNGIVSKALELVRLRIVKSVGDALNIRAKDTRALPGAALPGVHVFSYTEEACLARSSLHRDLQHRALSPLINNILTEESDKSIGLISFTVPIRLPEAGGGLVCVDADEQEVRVPYRLGRLYLHNGQNDHRIDDGYLIGRGDYRVTVQGHALVTMSGRLYYYW